MLGKKSYLHLELAPGSSFKFVIQQRFEMSQNYCIKFKKIKLNDLTKHYYNCENITDCYNLLVNNHKNLSLKL